MKTKTIDIDALIAETVPPIKNPQLAFTMPVRVDSETNAYEHWGDKVRRKRKQKEETYYAWRKAVGVLGPASVPCTVRLTRIGQKKLDDDNLGESFKAVRDAIADALRVDDGDECVKWEYAQVAVRKRVYSVRVEVY